MDDNEQDVEKLNEILSHHKTNAFEEEFCNFLDSNQYTEEDVFFDDNTDTSDIDEFDADSINVLTEDEIEIINTCVDYDLKQILELNRIKNFKLIKLRAFIDNLIENCNEMIKENQEEVLVVDNKQVNVDSVKLLPPIKIPIWKLGAPYFKCQNYYFSPYNDDVKRKRYNKELLLNDYLYEPKAWTKLDCHSLLNGVLFYYNINRQNEIKREIANLKVIIHDVGNDVDLLTELHRLEDELERLNTQKQIKNVDKAILPVLPKSDDYIDWNKIAEMFFYDKKTAEECRTFWHIYAHPSVNKQSWTKEENTKLRKLVKSYNYQNWEMITDELNNNRTAFTTALHFYRDLYNKFLRRKFTNNEDQLLLELIDLYRMGDFISWRKISEYFPNRSRQQLYHHYRYYLSMNETIKKGKFTDAEDILLLILVDRYGTDFGKCSKFIENRSHVQLKSRYRQNLETYKRKGTFTIDDDMEILKHVEINGESKWGKLSVKLNRTRGTVRQRYQTIKQYLKMNRNATIEDIPKRKHGELMKTNQQHYEFIRYVADKFKNSQVIPTLGMIEKFLNNDNNNDDDDGLVDRFNKKQKNYQQSIDAMLVDFFANSCTLKQHKYTNKSFDKISNDINTILSILNVNLEIPENLDDLQLDRIDKIILNQLKTIKMESNENCLVPPNINTLVGLRSMLLRYQLLDKQHDNQILLEIECDLQQHSIDEQNEILSDRQQFSERFNKLFMWSSILSLESPPSNDFDSGESTAKRRKLENIKTYTKRRNTRCDDVEFL